MTSHTGVNEAFWNARSEAWLSAAVSHLGEHLVSFDRDFRKLLSYGQFTLLAEVSVPGEGVGDVAR